MTSAAAPNTFNLDGEQVPMSLAWRTTCRRQYRYFRRPGVGYGPLGAREMVERLIAGRER